MVFQQPKLTMNTQPTKAIAIGILTVAASASALAQSFPQIPLSLAIKGNYSTNETAANYQSNANPVNTNVLSMKSFNVNLGTRDLLSILARSEVVSNTVVNVTGSNGIPAGSYFTVATDFQRNSVNLTNKSGFSFPLAGHDPVRDRNYSYVRLYLAEGVMFPASFNVNSNSTSGTEMDQALMMLTFNDGQTNTISASGLGQIHWAAAPHSTNATQKVSVNFNFNGAGYGTYQGNIAVLNVEANGAGNGVEKIADGEFPFWRWWQMQYQQAND